jgi:glucosamine--fructose-6-phosphate aminotransferase (isomerizing)
MEVNMCGVVGYIGRRDALPIVLEGLRRLEYRGYDSAGVALLQEGTLRVRKRAGKVADLAALWNGEARGATLGMGHTRWATHGEADDTNAHPHLDCHGELAVIHNGVIENYTALRTMLEYRGHVFRSQTDTEVLAHLIEEHLHTVCDLELAVQRALRHVEGTYGLIVLSQRDPGRMVAARKGSPLVIGYGDDEYLVASDASALIQHTRKVVYLEDGEIAVVSEDGVTMKTLNDEAVFHTIEELTFDLEEIEKGYYPHFMLKEIHEQPDTIANALRGRLLAQGGTAKLGGLESVLDHLNAASRLIFTACGTSWHAGLIGEYMLEQYTRKAVEVEYASEFRYRHPVVKPDDVVFLISQSGETADTLAALREARTLGAMVLGICNVVGSTIARESDGGVYLHAGPEIGVASTKAFTSQLTVLALITLLLARCNGMDHKTGQRFVQELAALPEKARQVLSDTGQIEEIAREFHTCPNFLYLGRGYNFPVALEGALKLKEVAYVYAEGYPAAEIKHGPLALIDENMPVVVIAPQDRTYEKVLSNIQEVKARRGKIIAIVNEPEEQILRLADHLICVPSTLDLLTPILTILPLQLLAYHIAVMRGYDVDQPRNLAKSVTVE